MAVIVSSVSTLPNCLMAAAPVLSDRRARNVVRDRHATPGSLDGLDRYRVRNYAVIPISEAPYEACAIPLVEAPGFTQLWLF